MSLVVSGVAAWTSHFNAALVALALVICAAGSFTVIALLGRGVDAKRRARWLWLGGIAISFGADVWATHFVAMLAFNPGMPCAYRPLPTLLSILIAIAGCVVAFGAILLRPDSRPVALFAGVALGLTIGAMHFMGMSAMTMAVEPANDPGFVILALAIGAAMSALAFMPASRLADPRVTIRSTFCLMAAICGLHFTAMGGFSLPPPPPGMAGRMAGTNTVWLAATVAGVSLLILFCALGVLVAERKINTLKAKEAARLQHFARHDELTGLPNRLFLRERLAAAVAAGQGFALHYIDLDRFKPVNDLFGHKAGDIVLTQVADRIRAELGEAGMAARFGGDEFIILHAGGRAEPDAAALAGRLVKSLGEPFDVEGHTLQIGASIGIATFPQAATTEELLRNADAALYRAKGEGGGVFCLFDPGITQLLLARRTFEQDFYIAVEARQFVVHYQPVFQCRTATLCGFEALLRWAHPVRGLVSPADFIPFADKSGLIVPLGLWVLETACREAMHWPAALRVAVNVSAVQLRNQDFFDHVRDVLDRTGLPPNRLELEVTETALIETMTQAETLLRRLKAHGVQLALDDFGTGYSSLVYLRRFSFDRIKIDQSFMRDLEIDEDAASIVRAILALGRSLRISVTAEGVERPSQLALLRDESCDQVQGYLLGRPVAVENISPLIDLFTADAYHGTGVGDGV